MGLGAVRESFKEEEAPSWLCGMCRVLIALYASKRRTEGEREEERGRNVYEKIEKK